MTTELFAYIMTALMALTAIVAAVLEGYKKHKVAQNTIKVFLVELAFFFVTANIIGILKIFGIW